MDNLDKTASTLVFFPTSSALTDKPRGISAQNNPPD